MNKIPLDIKVAGIAIYTMNGAKDKASKEQKGFIVQHQITDDVLGLLKPLVNNGENAYLFIPLLLDDETITYH